MKKLITLVLVAVLTSASVFANDKNTPETTQNLRKEIIDLLDKPSFKIENENIEACIEFTLNAKNEIVILTVDSDKEAIESYVKSRLNYKKVSFISPQNGQRTFKIKLKVINPLS